MAGGVCLLGLLALFSERTSSAPAAPVTAKELPIRRLHDVVQPARLDNWKIIGPGGGGTFYHPAISPHDPNLVFATTDMTECYVSENGGQTWRQFNLRFTCRFTFDPKKPERVYALTNPAGLWRTDDRGRSWSLVYPDPETVTNLWYLDDEGDPGIQTTKGYPTAMGAFAVDPDDSDTLYAIVPADLLVSHDAGKHWITLATGVNGQTIYVDPRSPRDHRRLFFINGGTTGVWDGTNYTGNLKVGDSKWFYGSAFGVDAAGKPVVYAVTDFIVKDGRLQNGGMLATDDGGVTWRSLNDGLLKLVAPGSYPEFSAVATSLHHPEVIYLSFYHWHPRNDENPYFGVAKSTDGGGTWKVVRMESGTTAENMHDAWISDRLGPDFADQPLNIAVDANNPDLVYTTDLGRIMRSTDGGRSWEAVYSQGAASGYTTTGLDVTTSYGVHFDPFDAKRMFISYTDIGLFRSVDGGQSWMSATVNGVPRAWQNTTYWMEFDPAVKGKMWAAMSGTHDLPRIRMFLNLGKTASMRGGVVMSVDGGNTWTVANKGLPDMAATHILLDPRSDAKARTLYVTGFGRGVYKSVDGGLTWKQKIRGLPASEPLTWRMAIDTNGVLYVVTVRRSQDGSFGTPNDGWLFRSRDGAENWEKVPLPEGVNGPMGITVDPADPERLYLSVWGRYKLYAAGVAAPQGGVFVSPDGGQHWSNTLDASRRIYDVTVDGRDPKVVYATGFEASAWRSADRGMTWKRIPGFNFKFGHRVIPDPADATQIYITTFGSSVWHGPAAGDPKSPEDVAGPALMGFGNRN